VSIKTNHFKMKNLRVLSFVAAAAVSTFAMSCENKSTEVVEEEVVVVEEAPAMAASNTVVDIAIGSPDHTTLVAAVTAAGLVETLQGDGPFTVFAPTNAAFAALPAGTVEGLLKPEAKDDLTSILTLHVVAGNVMAGDLSDGQMVTTLNGKQLKVTIKDGKVMIDGATVVAADLAGSNGVVHVIDTVILP
jgi:uncharacterized surface protein with fasciclin (FAS1) repeats